MRKVLQRLLTGWFSLNREGEAKALYNEIKQKVTSDWDFENREKYKDEAGLKKQRIEAARAIGVAFGNGQQPVTTNITWLH